MPDTGIRSGAAIAMEGEVYFQRILPYDIDIEFYGKYLGLWDNLHKPKSAPLTYEIKDIDLP